MRAAFGPHSSTQVVEAFILPSHLPMTNFKPRGVGLCALAFALLTACGTHTQVIAHNPSLALAPTCTEAVLAYASRENVPYDYYEVALITSEANAAYNGNGDILKAIRSKAATLGANGVILNSLGASHATVKVIGAAVGAKDSDRKGSAIAIWMPSDTARVRNTCGKG
jgi:hypothetical protein